MSNCATATDLKRETERISDLPLGRSEDGRTDGRGEGETEKEEIKVLDIRSFHVTVSTKEDLSDLALCEVKKWLEKHCHLCYCVTERGESGKVHLHACIVTNSSRHKKRIQDDLWTKVKKYHPTSIGKFAVKVQINPGNDWYTKYLQKEPDRVVIIDRWDSKEAAKWFPTKEDQAYLISTKNTQDASDPFYAGLNQKFCLYLLKFPVDPVTYDTTCQFMLHSMFVDKNCRVISDPRKYRQIAMALMRYHNADSSLNEADRAYARHETEPMSYDFSAPVRSI